MQILKREIYEFLGKLSALINEYPIDVWYKGCKDFIDLGCFLNPTAWNVGVDEVEKVKDILAACIELKKRLEKSVEVIESTEEVRV